MKSDKQCDILLSDNILHRGAKDNIASDSTQSEIVNKFKAIFRVDIFNSITQLIAVETAPRCQMMNQCRFKPTHTK